ncbi:MAG: transcriptional regulator [Rhodopirellula sp. JB044]|uniref:transcriptional regulator n=1 Tax=Rhodopirellula sp. JB044 TaxID=3342844 RepID=UPI00370A8B4B
MSSATLSIAPTAPVSIPSTITGTVQPAHNGDFGPDVKPARRTKPSLSPERMLRTAMLDADEWVVEFEYADSKGKRTRRTVSPIRFAAPGRFLALCLCREEPRQFYLNRCENFRLIRSANVMMPV